jgi:RNA polymerase sigma-70 factor (ECF subfamily)
MKVGKEKKHLEFETVLVPHMDQLHSYAYYMTGDREQAADLLQETFLKAYRFFDKFEQGTNAKAWLYRIMRNTYINEYRRVKRIPELVQFDEQLSAYHMLPGASHRSDDLRDLIENRMFDDDVTGAISSLPEKFKSVVVLRDIEDLPYEEIAEALDIPVGTVRSRLHRARGILFGRLKKYAQDRGYDVSEKFIPGAAAFARS